MNKIQKIPVLTPLIILPLLLMVAMATAQTSGLKKVAVLPLNFRGNSTEEMRYYLQDLTYNYLHRNADGFNLQNPAETNALLGRKEIGADNLRNYMPSELAAILGVDYVVTGRVSQEYAGATDNSRNTREQHRGREYQRNTQTRTTELFNTYIEVKIYNNEGENVYDKGRKSILYDVDAYKAGLHYLLKRSPLVKQ